VCDILEFLEAFGNDLSANGATDEKKEWGDVLVSIVDEWNTQKTDDDIWVEDLPGDTKAEANPITHDLRLDIDFLIVSCNPNDFTFWLLVAAIIHEGDHADNMATETGATTTTEQILLCILQDLAMGSSGFLSTVGFTGGGAFPPGPMTPAEIMHQKWLQKRYQMGKWGKWDQLGRALIKDRLSGGTSNFDDIEDVLEDEWLAQGPGQDLLMIVAPAPTFTDNTVHDHVNGTKTRTLTVTYYVKIVYCGFSRTFDYTTIWKITSST